MTSLARQSGTTADTVTPARAPTLQRACACGASKGVEDNCPACAARARLGVQPKLTVNRPGDRYEQEADRIANRVVSAHPAAPRLPSASGLQREEMAEEDELQTKPAGFQRQETQEEEELMMKPAGLQRQDMEEDEELQMESSGGGPSASAVTKAGAAVATGGQPLSRSERAYFEPRLGRDLSAVRLHDEARAGAAAKGINARAYTRKNHIAFSPGARDSRSTEGRRLMAHELVHTVQQRVAGPIGEARLQRKPNKEKHCRFTGETPSGTVSKIAIEGAPPTARVSYYLSKPSATFSYRLESTKLNAEHSPYSVTVLSGGDFRLTDSDAKALGLGPSDNKRHIIFGCDISQPNPKKFSYPSSLTVEVKSTPGSGVGGSKGAAGEGEDAVSGIEVEAEPAEKGGYGTESSIDDSSSGPGLGLEGTGSPTGGKISDKGSADNQASADVRPDEQRPVLDGKKLGALVTTDLEGAPENFVIGGTIEGFRDLSEGEMRERVRDVAVSTLAFCFELGHPFAEAAVDGPHVKLHLPRLSRSSKSGDSSDKLPVMVDIEALEIRFADDLGVTDGNVNCDNKEIECFFWDSICLPRINIPTSSIEEAEDVSTAIGAAEAVVDGAEIAISGGAGELVEEGAEQLAKQGQRMARRQARRNRRAARKLRAKARRSHRKDVRRARREIRKAGRKGDVRKITRERKAIAERLQDGSKIVRKSNKPGFDIEIEVNGVIYRRPKPFEGTWCRFNSPKDCGKDLGDEVDNVADIEAIQLYLPRGKNGESSFTLEELRSLSPEEHDAVVRDFMRRNGKVRIYESEAHHAFPQYLGGATDQALYSLDKRLHVEFHAGLDKVFHRVAGAKKFESLPFHKKVVIWGQLKLYTRQFDLWNDSNLSGHLREAFSEMAKSRNMDIGFDDL